MSVSIFTVINEHPNEFREKQWFMMVVSDLVQHNNNEISSIDLLLLSMLVQLLDSPTTRQSGWWQLAKQEANPANRTLEAQVTYFFDTDRVEIGSRRLLFMTFCMFTKMRAPGS